LKRLWIALALCLVAAPVASAACCYFAAKDKDITQPGQKAFLTWDPKGKVEAFTVQPKFEGNALDFGMVIPTPSRPKLDEMPRDLFKDLAIYTILMPLPYQLWVLEPPPPPCPSGAPGGGDRFRNVVEGKPAVRVLESGVVGSLDYKIIVADEAKALYSWLDENHYNYGGDVGTLDFYIAKKWFFTVMKIDSKQMKKADDGTYLGEITPTRFTFATDTCIYPLKITQLSVKDQTDALFYVQSPEALDLRGDLSWKHSFRVMWLTFMLGCGANEQQQQELTARNDWIEKKRAQDPRFETTKLEWAKKLSDGDLAVLDDPLAHYAQGGLGDLPAGAKVLTKEQFLAEAKQELASKDADYRKNRLEMLEAQLTGQKGAIVKRALQGTPGPFNTPYWLYPDRLAPEDDVKGLSRLKGHLQKGQWLVKFRKVLRKDEMTDDLVLVPVELGTEQEYVRIMPTSPP
jgi:hypothetical protein